MCTFATINVEFCNHFVFASKSVASKMCFLKSKTLHLAIRMCIFFAYKALHFAIKMTICSDKTLHLLIRMCIFAIKTRLAIRMCVCGGGGGGGSIKMLHLAIKNVLFGNLNVYFCHQQSCVRICHQNCCWQSECVFLRLKTLRLVISVCTFYDSKYCIWQPECVFLEQKLSIW